MVQTGSAISNYSVYTSSYNRGYALTHTLDAVSYPAVSAATLEAAGDVDAGGVHVTVVSSDLTFVNI